MIAALEKFEGVEVQLVHTGQHYEECMSRLFFEELHIREPDANLGVGSGTHATQTAEIMRRFEPLCSAWRPDWVVVVGDVNSTLACALVAVKLGIKVAHVEAGLRSFDRSMPEEINRMITDAISECLFVTEPSGIENLRREGVSEEKVHHVGNVMIDTLLMSKRRADESQILKQLELADTPYAVVTLHRPSNVDEQAVFAGILNVLTVIARDMPVIYPVHPRARNSLHAFGLLEAGSEGRICIEDFSPSDVELSDETFRSMKPQGSSDVRFIPPLGYIEFLKLISHAAIVLTDSGGIQEETTILGVPCLTLRRTTERPITVTHGTNRLTGADPTAILSAYQEVRERPPKPKSAPDLWDGRASDRIAKCLLRCS